MIAGFGHTLPVKVSPSIVDVIKNNLPSKKIDLREHLATVLADLVKLQPPMHRDGGTVEQLLAALPLTTPLVAEFAKLCETVVLMDDAESAKEIFQWFGKLLARHDPEVPGGTGTYSRADGDFFKVMSHELFVTLVSPRTRCFKFSRSRARR